MSELHLFQYTKWQKLEQKIVGSEACWTRWQDEPVAGRQAWQPRLRQSAQEAQRPKWRQDRRVSLQKA